MNIDNFLTERMHEETDTTRVIDMALWKARNAGMSSDCVRPYALGVLAAVLCFTNRRK